MKHAPPTDIVAGLLAGDPQAVRLAYERHKDDVLAVAAAVLGRAAAGDAWDVLHDVFVGLARAAKNLRPDTNLRAYLVRAAANRARDRRPRISATVDVGDHDLLANEPGVLDQLERDEDLAALWGIVSELPDEQRIVVALRIWGDLTFREIAHDQSISENTAQSRYRYALKKLRRHYQGVER